MLQTSEITRMVIVNDKKTFLYWTVRQEGFMNTEVFGHQEKANIFDPYAMTSARIIKATVTEIQVVGHLPRKISRFSKFFCDYGGEHSTLVRDPKYRRSPIPQGGLEIPITLKVFKGDTPDHVFKKMWEFLERFYVEPDKTPPTESLASDDEGEVL